MNKMIEITAGESIDLLQHGLNLENYQIKRLWTVYDEKEMWENNKFNPHTGQKIESIDDLVPEHLKGTFIEDFFHDWRIRNNRYLDYYSRVVSKGSVVKILLQLVRKQ